MASTRTRTLRGVVWLSTTVVVGCVVLLVVRGRPLDVFYGLWIILNAPSAVLALWFGHLVLQRFPAHGAGRILITMGALSALHVVAATVADVQLVAAGHAESLAGDHGIMPADLPLWASVPLLAMNVLWVPVAILSVLLIAFFPDGALRSIRWRWVPAAAMGAAGLLMAATAADAWPTADWVTGDEPSAVGLLFLAGGVMALIALVGGVISFVLRWRSSGPERRAFEGVGGILILFVLLGIGTYPWPQIWAPLVHFGFGLFLLTYGLAIGRFRLHDVEPVIGKGAVVTALSVLAMACYLAIVVGLGRMVEVRTSDPALPLVAVAVIALLVEPTRRVLRRGVDRLLYDGRAEPADVLSHLASHGESVDESATTDIAEMVLHATGAAHVEIELALGEEPPSLVTAGHRMEGAPRLQAMVGDEDRNRGEIRVYARAASDLLPEASRLLQDVARLLWVLLENHRLAHALSEQLAETRASRQRIVEAQDRARRELERDVHDGAQARLIAVRMYVGEVSRRVETGTGGELTEGLDRIAHHVDAAIRDLRALSRGLHPPVLEQLGVTAAVRAHVREAALPVEITQTGTARYSRAVEGAAYFACIEAIQNALRHSDGATISIAMACDPSHLQLTVGDDGCGFDPTAVRRSGLDGITDRVSALGGTTQVSSAPGSGTRIQVTIPVAADQAQPSTAAR